MIFPPASAMRRVRPFRTSTKRLRRASVAAVCQYFFRAPS